MAVVKVKGAIKAVDLGETYITPQAPVVRLFLLKAGVRRGLEFRPFEAGDLLKGYPGDRTNPGGEPSLERRSKEGEATLGKPETDSREMRQTRVDWRIEVDTPRQRRELPRSSV